MPRPLGDAPARGAATPGPLGRGEQPGRRADDLVQISNRIPADRMLYLRRLSLDTGREQRVLLVEALDLLREQYGDV